MIYEQPDLSFHPRARAVTRAKSLVPVADQQLLDGLLFYLAQAHDWLTAADLCKLLDLPVNETSKRHIRAAAEDSQGKICSGNNGYKLMERCTINEWLAFKHRMLNQAITTIRRVKQSAHHRRTPQQRLL
jgi:hypothetical protein